MAERLASEEYSIIATVDPDAYATGTQNSDAFNMENYSKVMGIVLNGAFGTAGTLDAWLKTSATSNGTFTTIGTGKKITQLTEAGSDDDKQAIINLNAVEVAATTHQWVRMEIKMTSTTASDFAGVVLGKPRHTEAHTTVAANDLSTVDEIVN